MCFSHSIIPYSSICLLQSRSNITPCYNTCLSSCETFLQNIVPTSHRPLICLITQDNILTCRKLLSFIAHACIYWGMALKVLLIFWESLGLIINIMNQTGCWVILMPIYQYVLQYWEQIFILFACLILIFHIAYLKIYVQSCLFFVQEGTTQPIGYIQTTMLNQLSWVNYTGFA